MNRHATLLSLACLALSTLAAAQATNTFSFTGDVGIGTISPNLAPLQTIGMVGNTAAAFASDTAGISLIGNWPGMYFNGYWASGVPYAFAPGYGGSFWVSPSDGHFEWRTTNSVAVGSLFTETPRIVLTNNGDLGIGTTSPAQMLEVSGNAQVDGSLQLGSSGVQITSSGIVFPNGGGTQSAAWTGTICGGDFAESVDVSGDRAQYSPGDVLVVDADIRVLRPVSPHIA